MNGEVPVSNQSGERPKYEAEVLLDTELRHLLAPPMAVPVGTSESISVEEVAAEYARPYLERINDGAGPDDHEEQLLAVASEEIVAEKEITESGDEAAWPALITGKKAAAKRPKVRPALILSPVVPSPEASAGETDRVAPPEIDTSAATPSPMLTSPTDLSNERRVSTLRDPQQSSADTVAAQENIPKVGATVRYGQYEEFIVFMGAAAEKLRQNRNANRAASSKPYTSKPEPPAVMPPVAASGPSPQVFDQEAEPHRYRETSEPSRQNKGYGPDFEEQEPVTIYQLDAINILDEQGVQLDGNILDQSSREVYFNDKRILNVLKMVCLEHINSQTAETPAANLFADLLEYEKKRLLAGFRELASKLNEDAAEKQKQPKGLRRIVPKRPASNGPANIAAQYITVQQQLRRQANPGIRPEDLRPEKIIADKVEELSRNLSPQSFMTGSSSSGLLAKAELRERFFGGRPANQQILFASEGEIALLLKYPEAQFLLECTGRQEQAGREDEVLTATPLTDVEYRRFINTAEYLLSQAVGAGSVTQDSD